MEDDKRVIHQLVMRRFAMEAVLITLLSSLLALTGAEELIPVQVVPTGIGSSNGSAVDMGCSSPLVDSHCGSLMICDGDSQSYLVDGNSPAIDTSTSDWASQLVTVRKTPQTDEIQFDHVLLTFGFDKTVTMTGIELDLFLCPELNIGAPYVTVYADEKNDLVFTADSLNSQNYTSSNSSCDSLSTVNITFQDSLANLSYLTWHILVSQFNASIDWVYVGEVRFLGMDIVPSDAEILTPVEVVVPQGIHSVNGSVVNMGCTSPVVDSDGVTICNMSQSYLLDDCSPTIDTSTSDWASELVTVAKNDLVPGSIYDPHALLTFSFGSDVAVTSVELDLFLCPKWNIVPSYVDVYAGVNKGFILHVASSILQGSKNMMFSPKSCDSLKTVSIPTVMHGKVYDSMWHILFLISSVNEWVHIGEVRLMGSSHPPNIEPTPPGPNGSNTTTTSIAIPPRVVPSSSRAVIASSLVTSTSVLSSPLSSSQYSTVVVGTSSATRVTLSKVPSSEKSADITRSSASVTRSSFLVTTTSVVPSLESSADPSNNPNIPMLHIVIAGGGGLIILLILLVVIGCCCIVARYRSRVKRKNLHKLALDSPDFSSSNAHLESVTTNGHHSCAPNASNPMYVGIEEPRGVEEYRASCLYEPIPGETLQTTTFSDKRGVQWTGLYDVVTEAEKPLEESPIKSPDTVCEGAAPNGRNAVVREGSVENGLDAVNQDSPARDEEEEDGSARRDEGAAAAAREGGAEHEEAEDLYIEMMRSRFPLVVSPDLEQCLIQHYDDGIYSERIDPSDFTRGAPQNSTVDQEQELEFFPPVYPALAYPPQGIKPVIEVSGENIKELKQLRIGQFGKTILANTVGLSLKAIGLSKTDDNESISIRVAMKKLCPHPSRFTYEQEALFKESKFMSHLKHPNVLRLLGVCYNNPLFVMMEYTDEGDLNQFLQRCSEIVPIKTPSSQDQITTPTLIYMASQIANAMKYLSELHFVHRDLSTRNCFIETNTVVKVADLGVNMDRYRHHYFMIQGNTLLPIRWMAPECFNGTYSEKSDVWAFGVTMWELFTLAKEVPYANLSDEEVVQNTLQRESCQFPSKPAACPDSLYEIIESCRVIDMSERATFTNLHKMLQSHV